MIKLEVWKVKMVSSNDQNAVFILLTSDCQLICETELNVTRIRLVINILYFIVITPEHELHQSAYTQPCTSIQGGRI